MTRLTDDELIEFIEKQLPDLLKQRPDLEPRIYHAFLKALVKKKKVDAVLAERRDCSEVGQ